MALIGRLVGKLLTHGQHHRRHAGRQPQTYGPGGGQARSPSASPTARSRSTSLDNPRLGVGEAYMDGRLIIEDGTILDLLELIVGVQPLGGRRQGPQGARQGQAARLQALLPRATTPTRARRNVAHHYDLERRALRPLPRRRPAIQLRLLHRPRQQPRAGAGRQEGAYRRQARARSPASACSTSAAAGAGWRSICTRSPASTCSASPCRSEQLKVARERAEAAGVADQVKFELIDYRAVEGQFDRIVSVGMFEHVGAAHYDEFFAKCRELLKPTTA